VKFCFKLMCRKGSGVWDAGKGIAGKVTNMGCVRVHYCIAGGLC
jgi:hypothetical protein